MKTTQTIGKVVVFALFVFMGLFTACQSTGGTKRNSEAVKAFERGESLYKKGALKEAIMEYTTAIEIEPKWAEAFIMRGYVHGLNENSNLALEDYETATAFDPKYEDFKLASIDYRNENYSQAIETFNKVIRNRIKLMIAYEFRGNSYNAVGELEKALADYTEAIRLNPDFYGNYAKRAHNYNGMKQYDMAIADCDQAIRLYPDSFYGYLYRAEAHFRKERTRQAFADINRAIQLNLDNRGRYASYSYGLRAEIYLEEGDFSNAITDYSQYIQLLPDDPACYLQRGYCYLQVGDYDKAAADIDMVLKLDPGNESALYARGLIRAARAAQ